MIGSHELVDMFQRTDRLSAFLHERQIRAGGVHPDAEKRNALDECAVVAGGLESVRFELRCDVLPRQQIAPGRRPAPFKEIRGQKTHVRPDLIFIDRLGGALPGPARNPLAEILATE